MKLFTRQSFSATSAARADAVFERRSDPPGSNTERIDGDTEPCGQIAPAVDALPTRVGVVTDDQLLLLRLQSAKASVETVETPLPNERAGVVRLGGRRPGDGVRVPYVVEPDVP